MSNALVKTKVKVYNTSTMGVPRANYKICDFTDFIQGKGAIIHVLCVHKGFSSFTTSPNVVMHFENLFHSNNLSLTIIFQGYTTLTERNEKDE